MKFKRVKVTTLALLLSMTVLFFGCEASGLSKGGPDGSSAFEKSIRWDGEYDVVVVGLGGAGGVTSITAVNAGSKVLLLEKAH